MFGSRMAVLGTVLYLALALTAEAQSSRYEGQQIVGVEYVGLQALPAETLSFYLFDVQAAAGRRLDLDELNDRVKFLWERELVDDVDIETESVDGGVKLIIRVVERPMLVSIAYQGLDRVTRADVQEQIDRDRVNVYENQPLAAGELMRLAAVIEKLYREKGFRFAEVRYRLEEVAPGRQRAVFEVDEGSKVRIADIAFDGNTVYGDWRLRRAMKKTKEKGLISRFTKKDIYNPAHLDEDLEAVKGLYRRAGYKDVRIARPELSVKARNPDAPTLEDQKRRLALTVPVEEGERWRLGQIRVEGNEVFNDQVLLRQFEAPRGGWLRSKNVEDAVEKIDKLYKSVGYVFAQVSTEIEEVDEGTADVVVKLDERDQFRVGRLEFAGNTKTQDKVLRRQMFLQEGSVMNMSAVQNSLLRIRQLNYFALDDEEPVQFDFDSEDRQVELEVKGEEAERTELQFGGGWSEPAGFFGQFAIRTTNFRGRGETLGLSLQAGQETELYDLDYRIPWFLDRPQNVGFRIFSQRRNVRTTDDFLSESRRAGASLTYGRSLRGFSSLNFAYTFSDVEQLDTQLVPVENDTADGEQDGVLSRQLDFRISSIRPSWVYNTLDSRYEPTRGLHATASFEIAGGVLGGDSSYLRPQVGLTYFKLLSRRPFKSAFGLNVEAGWIAPYDGAELFSQQRFALGGESVRGFRSGNITVRGEGEGRPLRFDDGGYPLGGEKKLVLNLEYHVMPEGPFRLVFFTDAGGVFAGDQPVSPDLMRFTAGAELRVMVPLFPAPLRLIFARNLDPLPGDRFKSIDFSLSTSF